MTVQGLGKRFDPSLCGGYDMRGKAMEYVDKISGQKKKPNLTPEIARHIGRALGSRLNVGSTVFIGRDGRLTSPELMEALIEGYLEMGINVDANKDTIPTGATNWIGIQKKYVGVVQISGSHNPAPDNGLKISEHGQALYADRLKEIIPAIQEGSYRTGAQRGVLKLVDVRPGYYGMLETHFVELSTPRHIIFDAGNGIGGEFLPILAGKVATAGGSVTPINYLADGAYPAYGMADPSKPLCVNPVRDMVLAQNIDIIAIALSMSAREKAELISQVIGNNRDMGIPIMEKLISRLDQDTKKMLTIAVILDGDADRCGFVDEAGAPVAPEKMAAIFYLQYLRNLQKGVFPSNVGNFMALDVRSSTATVEMVADNNGNGWFTQAGYPAHRLWARSIIEAIGKTTITQMSAEASGHFFFPTAMYGARGGTHNHAQSSLIDDGIFATLQFLSFLDAQAKTTTLHDFMGIVPSKPVSEELRIESTSHDKKWEIAQYLIDTVPVRYADELRPLGRGVIEHEGLRIQDPKEGLILVDGVRPQFRDGSMFMGRPSNTSFMITGKVQADDMPTLIKRTSQLRDLLEPYRNDIDMTEIQGEIARQKTLLGSLT